MATRSLLPFTQWVVEPRAMSNAAAEPPSVLVVMKNRPLVRSVSRVIRGSGARVIEVADLDMLAAAPPVDLAIYDFDELGPAALDTLRGVSNVHGRTTPVLLMSEREIDPLASPLFASTFYNVIAKIAKDGSFNTPDLLVTMRKLLDRDIFGVEKYVHWGALLSRIPFASTKDVPLILACFESFMRELEIQGRRSRELLTVAEELVTNSLFNAAMDAQGNRMHAHRHRSEHVELPAERCAELSFATDGHILAVGCRDAWGTLDQGAVLRGLRRCAARGEDQVRLQGDQGGAGIGLYMVYEYADHMVINLRPGVATEIIAIVELGLKQRDRRSTGRSLNVFAAIDHVLTPTV